MPGKILPVYTSTLRENMNNYERPLKSSKASPNDAAGNSLPLLPQTPISTDTRLFYTAQECAEILRYEKPDKVYLLVRSGILKGFKRGKRWLIDKEHFDRWCRRKCGLI